MMRRRLAAAWLPPFCVLALLMPAGTTTAFQTGAAADVSGPPATDGAEDPDRHVAPGAADVPHIPPPTHGPQRQANAQAAPQPPWPSAASAGLHSAEEIARRERMQMWLAEAAAYVYLFAFGATLGSFLNVVVYRMPRGMGLLRPASRCPWCQTPIRLSDNLPLVGWLKLRGRCRACRLPISPRYPLVEALCGLLWMGLAMVELFSGGANLPGHTPPRHVGALWLLWQPHWPLLRLYVYHAVLLYLLLGLALIAADGFRPPRRLWLAWLLIGILAPLGWADLHPVRPAAALAEWEGPDLARGALGALAGLSVGALAGGCLALAWRERKQRVDLVLGLTGVGAYLGWQGTLGTGLLVVMLMLAVFALARCINLARQVPALMLLTCGALVHVPCWALLVDVPGWPGPATGIAWGAALFAVLGLLAVVARWVGGLPLVPAVSPVANAHDVPAALTSADTDIALARTRQSATAGCDNTASDTKADSASSP